MEMDRKEILNLFDKLPEETKEMLYTKNRNLMIVESANLKTILEQMYTEQKVNKSVVDNYNIVMGIIVQLDTLLLFESLTGILTGIFEAMVSDVKHIYGSDSNNSGMVN